MNRFRRILKRAQHGASSQIFPGRHRESWNQWNPIDSNLNQLNCKQLICTGKSIGADGIRWIEARHGASSQTFHQGHDGLKLSKVKFNYYLKFSVLKFSILAPFLTYFQSMPSQTTVKTYSKACTQRAVTAGWHAGQLCHTVRVTTLAFFWINS